MSIEPSRKDFEPEQHFMCCHLIHKKHEFMIKVMLVSFTKDETVNREVLDRFLKDHDQDTEFDVDLIHELKF